MKITLQLKYLAVIPPVASICLTYLAWRWLKCKALIGMHNYLEEHNDEPADLLALQSSVENNSNLMLLSCVVVMLSWFMFEKDSIANIYTYMIGSWIYKAIELLVTSPVHML